MSTLTVGLHLLQYLVIFVNVR